jgi:hypothetical protein
MRNGQVSWSGGHPRFVGRGPRSEPLLGVPSSWRPSATFSLAILAAGTDVPAKATLMDATTPLEIVGTAARVLHRPAVSRRRR